LGVLSAHVMAAALAGAYRESAILNVLVSLVVPPLVLFFVYRGSAKRYVFCAASLLISGMLFDLSPAFGVPRAGLRLVLMTVGAIGALLIVDLLVVDMGRQIHVTRQLARTAQIGFLLALFPLAGWKLLNAHATILKEDQRLVGEFQEEQVRKLLDVVAVIDAVVAQGVAETPEFLDDVGHGR